MNNKGFIRLAWATLVVVFLVILAGSVVRTTGSGMGCPDWPKCFGYLIPPTEYDQVQFQPNKEYKKGQMIIVGDELLQANEDFTSSEQFNASEWQVHEKHDYSRYNPNHTWIEYINRLLGALSGLFMLALFCYALLLASKGELAWQITILVFIGVLLLGFQAWLGRTVVDSNLEASKITAHMFGAIALIVVLLVIIRFGSSDFTYVQFKSTKGLAWLCLLLLTVQIALGTNLRQVVDEFLPQLDFDAIFSSSKFLTHRSFSWLLLLSTIGLFGIAAKYNDLSKQIYFSIAILLVEFVIGIILYKNDIPKFAQPIHLVLSTILFSSLFWIAISKTRKVEI